MSQGGVNHPPPPGSTEVIAFSRESESCLLILCVSIIDPISPRINRGDCLFTWKLTVDPLCVNCRSAPPQDQQRQSPFHTKVKVDCWSSLCWSLIPPWSTEVITFSHKSESWPLILSLLIVNPPPPGSTEAIAFSCKSESWLDPLCVDHRSAPPGSTT